jgi:hypothetical protein
MTTSSAKRVSNKELSEQVNKLTDLVGVMLDLHTADSPSNKAEPVVVEPTTTGTVVYDSTFVSKFDTQLPRAIALAKKNGKPAEIAAVSKDGTMKCWYYTQGRKMPSNATKLVEVQPNGKIKALAPLGNLKVA